MIYEMGCSRIPTIPAETRTGPFPICSLLTVVSSGGQSAGPNSTQEGNSVEAIGLLVTLEARAGKEVDAEAFLKSLSHSR